MQAVKKQVVVKPNGSVEIPASEFSPGTALEVILMGDKKTSPQKKEKAALFKKLRGIKIDGPPDWSANVDKYLYGSDIHGK